jgi:arylsulfatase A-like enzyme
MIQIKGQTHTARNYEHWGRKGGWTSSYGQGWANLSNVPFRRYKRENHEGGISAPFIVHWPKGIESAGTLRHQVAHLMKVGVLSPAEFDQVSKDLRTRRAKQ